MRRVLMLNLIYLDFASSTPIHPEVLKTVTEMMPIHYANAESLHQAGLTIHTMMEESRVSLSKALKVDASTLYFTSGATEANNLLIKGIALANQSRGKHLITSQVEHASVLESFRDLETNFGFEVTYLPVNQKGYVEPSILEENLRADTSLVSLMAVNNETGAIFETQLYARLIHEKTNAFFHVDAVQALAKIEFTLEGIDAASFSAHKIQGVKGSGLMYLKEGIRFQPLITGGQQEKGYRPGTANAIGHIVFAKTLRLALELHHAKESEIRRINTYCRSCLAELESIKINSDRDGSPYILNISSLNLPSQVMLNHLSQKGICISAAATCSSRSFKPSHVLTAMHLNEHELEGVLRLSFGYTTTQSDIDAFIDAFKDGVKRYGK